MYNFTALDGSIWNIRVNCVDVIYAAKWRLFCLADGPMDINGITAGPNSSEVLPSSRATEEEPSRCHFRLPRLSLFQLPSLLHVIWTDRSSRSYPDVFFWFPVRRRLQLPTFRLFLLVSLDVCAARSMLAARRLRIYRYACRAADAA